MKEAKNHATPYDVLEDTSTDLMVQAGALECLEMHLLEKLSDTPYSDLVAVTLDAIAANLRKDAESISAASLAAS